jgi:hypothetical protein
MEKMSVLGLYGIKYSYVFQFPYPLFLPNFVTCMILVEITNCILVVPRSKFAAPKSTHNEHLLPQITWVTQQIIKALICVYKKLALVLV